MPDQLPPLPRPWETAPTFEWPATLEDALSVYRPWLLIQKRPEKSTLFQIPDMSRNDGSDAGG